MKKTFLTITVLLVLVIGAVFIWALITFAPPSRPATAAATAPSGLLQPSLHSDNGFAKAATVHPHPTPTPPPQVIAVAPTTLPPPPPENRKRTPMRIYTSTAPPEPEPEQEEQGYYAPAYRIVRCALINTVDSNSITTPIIGVVTDDVVWDGHVILARGTEVHGTALVDKNRERIAAEGAWTFVLFDPGLRRLDGRELVVKGIVLDSEYDPEFTKLIARGTVVDTIHKTWGITEGGAGLRGVVIQVDNAATIKLFVAAFMSGLAQSIQGTTTNVFGQTTASQNASGAGGVSGAIINPPAQGIQAVMDRYAQMVMDSIQRDGFFIRVPAGKLFEVYVREPINLAKATVGGSKRLAEVEESYLNDRARQERITEPRSTRDERERSSSQNQMQNGIGTPINPALTQRLDEATTNLQNQANKLQEQSNQLNQPLNASPTPTQ